MSHHSGDGLKTLRSILNNKKCPINVVLHNDIRPNLSFTNISFYFLPLTQRAESSDTTYIFKIYSSICDFGIKLKKCNSSVPFLESNDYVWYTIYVTVLMFNVWHLRVNKHLCCCWPRAIRICYYKQVHLT